MGVLQDWLFQHAPVWCVSFAGSLCLMKLLTVQSANTNKFTVGF